MGQPWPFLPAFKFTCETLRQVISVWNGSAIVSMTIVKSSTILPWEFTNKITTDLIISIEDLGRFDCWLLLVLCNYAIMQSCRTQTNLWLYTCYNCKLSVTPNHHLWHHHRHRVKIMDKTRMQDKANFNHWWIQCRCVTTQNLPGQIPRLTSLSQTTISTHSLNHIRLIQRMT